MIVDKPKKKHLPTWLISTNHKQT